MADKTLGELNQVVQRHLDAWVRAIAENDLARARKEREAFRSARAAYIIAAGGEMPGAPTRH